MDKFIQLQALVEATSADADKFSKGNSAAGTRVRKAMQEVKALAQEIRNDVTSAKNAGK